MSVAPEHQPAPVAVGPTTGARSTATDLALVATFAAVIAVCAVLPAIPVGGLPVPITLQTFGVFLAAAVLGPRRGTLAVLLYLAVGLAGLPVFARGGAGLGVLQGATAGYLLSFPLAAALAGLLVQRVALRLRSAWRGAAVFASCMVASLLTVHPLGVTVWALRTGMGPAEAVASGAVFLPGDVVKNAVVAVVAVAVHRAFPGLLRRR